MALFQQSVINRYLDAQAQVNKTLEQKWQMYSYYFQNETIQNNIKQASEIQYQGEFLNNLFVYILGYTRFPNPNFTLKTEYKNETNNQRVDCAIFVENKVRGVIELKDTKTADLGKVENQAFGYKNRHSDCIYVITSNFEKLRFYIENAVEYIEFDLFSLTKEEFALLYLCLGYENIAQDIPKKMKEGSEEDSENKITQRLYNDYSVFKNELYQNILTLNYQKTPKLLLSHAPKLWQISPKTHIITLKITPELLLIKTQKLLDRFLFLCFAEDKLLLAANSVKLILDKWKKPHLLDDDLPLYDRFKKYFSYLHTGFERNQDKVFGYNGGLFRPDAVLDALKITDNLLYKHISKLASYNFASEVDVNILGRIFENSLNQSVRKKDGVFYTPKYITKYMVENTIGKLCTEKKAALDIREDNFDLPLPISKNKKEKEAYEKRKKELLVKIKTYSEWLLELTILDPACGSGAFLNEALQFLIEEHKYIGKLQGKLSNGELEFKNIENTILENNIFGVDLNEESVEIAKLSLWLRTAHPDRKLTDLSNNLKCGNSLIDDAEIAGNKAFNWQENFPKVFAKGGFDVVIGNPPYGAYLKENQKIFLEKHFQTFEYQVNTYILFYEKGINLLKKKGILGFITPAGFTYQHYSRKLRALIQNYTQIAISKYLYEVFYDASIGDSVSWIIKKEENTKEEVLVQICNNPEDTQKPAEKKSFESLLNAEGTYILSDSHFDFAKFKTNSFVPLEKIANIIVGIKPYQMGKGTPAQTAQDVKNKPFTASYKKDNTFISCVTGSHFHRYSFLNEPPVYLSYGEWLAELRPNAPFFEEKIIIRQTADSLICQLDTEKRINVNNVYNVGLIDKNFSLKYLLVILNSKLMNFMYQAISQEKGRLFAEVKKTYLAQLVIKILSIEAQQPFIEKADKMIELHKNFQNFSQKFQRSIMREFSFEKFPSDLKNWYSMSFKEFVTELERKKVKLTLSQKVEWEEYFLVESLKVSKIAKEIADKDKEIDKMVYALYALTPEEIEIVEKGK